jgi:hypothetical protein
VTAEEIRFDTIFLVDDETKRAYLDFIDETA